MDVCPCIARRPSTLERLVYGLVTAPVLLFLRATSSALVRTIHVLQRRVQAIASATGTRPGAGPDMDAGPTIGPPSSARPTRRP